MAKSNLEKSLFWVTGLEGKRIMAEEAWQQEAERSLFNHMHKAEKVNWKWEGDSKVSEPAPSDTLLRARIHLLKVP